MQPTTQSQAPYARVSLFFFFVWLIVNWGFYRTYIIFFPSFDGFKPIQHFHGAMMMTWMALLIVQPLLIRAGKLSLHRLIGKLSFVIAPIVLLSMILITKFGYDKSPLPHVERVGKLALQSGDIVQFALFYCLAIVNRKNTYNHMRYMIGTAVMMIGPGLGRALAIYNNVPFDTAIAYTFYAEIAIVAAFLLGDLLRKGSYKANAIVLTGIFVHFLVWEFRLHQPWQAIGEFIAGHLF
ncbi:MAG TPA: hypothetical protein VHE34_29115 [Puia sp.]|uniref:hypothetical protein n=1 Tax=Puia sp. TaxID=2045100 RepID=UPI002B89C804|nr:hypothetical protein [Puia sp.]HVU99330.1 hypothetical protein [Puia sp.]